MVACSGKMVRDILRPGYGPVNDGGITTIAYAKEARSRMH